MTAEDIFLYYYERKENIEKRGEVPFHVFTIPKDDLYGGVCITDNEFGVFELGFIEPKSSEEMKSTVNRSRSVHMFNYYIPQDEAEQFQRECGQEFKSFPLPQSFKSKYDELFQYLMNLEVV